jgi:hypothetical protein
LSESWRIPRLANDDQARPHALGRRKLALCFVLAAKAMSWMRPPRRDSAGSASMAASAPPNSLTRARNVAGPTFSLLISLSQARRWRWLRRAGDLGKGAGLELVCANPGLLAAHKPADIGGVADIKKRGEQQEQAYEPPLRRDCENADARRARDQRRQR